MLDEFGGSWVFSKLDLTSAYHQLRLRDGHQWMTAFRTPRGLFEYLVCACEMDVIVLECCSCPHC